MCLVHHLCNLLCCLALQFCAIIEIIRNNLFAAVTFTTYGTFYLVSSAPTTQPTLQHAARTCSLICFSLNCCAHVQTDVASPVCTRFLVSQAWPLQHPFHVSIAAAGLHPVWHAAAGR